MANALLWGPPNQAKPIRLLPVIVVGRRSSLGLLDSTVEPGGEDEGGGRLLGFVELYGADILNSHTDGELAAEEFSEYGHITKVE